MAITTETDSKRLSGNRLDLEPTLQLQFAVPNSQGSGLRPEAGLDETIDTRSMRHGPKPSAGIGVREGSFCGFSSETHSLRQDRIRAAATFLATSYLVLFLWVFLTSQARMAGVMLILMGTRCALATLIAGFLWRRPVLDALILQVIEYGLFGGLTAILVISQYVVNLELLQAGDLVGSISYIKGGNIQMLILMFLYGTFIPNRPAITARVVSAMALAAVIGLFLLIQNERLAPAIEQLRLRNHQQMGSNVLILIIGAALAIYSSFTLNRLRVQIHEAKKFGQYQLRDRIGAGGMGEVYRAEHQLLKRPCAIKLIKPAALANPLAFARFEREVQSSARLAHPNTIEIFDYGHTDDGTFYYVMELLKGTSLADLVRQAGPLPPGRAIYLIRQVCAGLAEAHQLGLVHRDLKPANIFVALLGGESDVVKVLDFGLVKLTNEPDAAELSSELTVSGTPLYMAPEQAGGDRELDARADIYALGAILYFTLTGRPPFQGGSPFAVMMAHARDEVPLPSTLRPDIPADLEAIVMKCLAKKPEDRYQGVRALAKALAKCDAGHDWDSEAADAWWAEASKTINV